MATNHTIELDIAHDYQPTIDAITDELTKEVKQFGLTVELVKKIGPAGGNPLYRFTGPIDGLRAYIKAFHNPGLEGKDLEAEVDYHLERAKPVN